MHRPETTRRALLKRFGTATAATAAAGLWRPAGVSAAAAPAARKRVLRVAHLTDVHVEPEMGAADGLAQCLRHVQAQPDNPDVIFMTGDCVFDSFHHGRARTQLQWDLWNTVWKAECSLERQALLGNHDIWGWNKAKSKTTGQEGDWGKRWAMDELGLSEPYHSFDRAGWHVVMLDSVHPADRAFDSDQYVARLDDEQFAWLARDLAAVPAGTPTLVMSHVPILSVSAFFGPDSQKPAAVAAAATPSTRPTAAAADLPDAPDTTIGRSVMHADWRRIKDLFAEHPTVKLAVSGHIHLLDRVDYGGVTYLCNGAVCGGWWKGKNMGDCDAGYTLLDLYDDGSFEHRYVTYGWTYRPAPAGAE